MSCTLRSGRRDFLKMAAAGVAATLTTPGFASDSQAESIAVMKVGALGLDYSFWDIWANVLSPKGKYEETRTLSCLASS